MKLGEIKIEALKLMFANVDTDLTVDRLEQYKSQQAYREYLAGMPGAINRCFSDIENRMVLPTKTATVNYGDLLPDVTDFDHFYGIKRIFKKGSNHIDNNVRFEVVGTELMLEELCAGESYVIEYYPRLDRITSSTGETTELSIPDYIATAIPYYIKGDLFRVDEPNEAAESRNYYESAMASIRPINENGQQTVHSVYEVGL